MPRLSAPGCAVWLSPRIAPYQRDLKTLRARQSAMVRAHRKQASYGVDWTLLNEPETSLPVELALQGWRTGCFEPIGVLLFAAPFDEFRIFQRTTWCTTTSNAARITSPIDVASALEKACTVSSKQ